MVKSQSSKCIGWLSLRAMNDFLIPASNPPAKIKPGHIAWRSPSNIAIVKYWGKYGQQFPANPSLSMTLENAYTETHLFYKPRAANDEAINYTFDNQKNRAFEARIQLVFKSWKEYFPFLDTIHLDIHSKNSFPHSTGIASSASSMSALALCVVALEQLIYKRFTDKEFFQKASFMARLASGSACRSVFPCFSVWGKTDHVEGSHDAYAIPLERFHPIFASLLDDIIIVSSDEKAVSSSAGHVLMNDHPFAESRYTQARRHTEELNQILKSGDLDRFGEIAEMEAMTLHALMMCSQPSYTLMLPNTLTVINKVRDFRRDTKLPVYFSLDAGPNPHILYPSDINAEVEGFILNEIKPLAEEGKVLKDHCGKGPFQLS